MDSGAGGAQQAWMTEAGEATTAQSRMPRWTQWRWSWYSSAIDTTEEEMGAAAAVDNVESERAVPGLGERCWLCRGDDAEDASAADAEGRSPGPRGEDSRDISGLVRDESGPANSDNQSRGG